MKYKLSWKQILHIKKGSVIGRNYTPVTDYSCKCNICGKTYQLGSLAAQIQHMVKHDWWSYQHTEEINAKLAEHELGYPVEG